MPKDIQLEPSSELGAGGLSLCPATLLGSWRVGRQVGSGYSPAQEMVRVEGSVVSIYFWRVEQRKELLEQKFL